MRAFEYKVFGESPESQSRVYRMNPAKVLCWQVRKRLYRAILPCGYADDWYAFRQGSEIFVVSRNVKLGYCGLWRFAYDPKGEIDICGRITVAANAEVFFQNATNELLTDKWETWTLRTLARRLQGCL